MPPRNASRPLLLHAHRPSPEFAARVRALAVPVIVVDDGSGAAFRPLFDELAALPRVTVLRHTAHRGEAASLATALRHLLRAGAAGEAVPAAVEIRGIAVSAVRWPWLIRFPLLAVALRLRAWLALRAPWLLTVLLFALLAALVAVEFHGFAAASLFAQDLWEPAGKARLLQFAGLFCAVSLPVLILLPWCFTALAAGLLALATLALLPQATLAAAYVLLSAWCCGELLSGARKAPWPHSLALGIAVYVVPMPLLARLPIHYPAVWLALLALPILLRRPRPRLPAFSVLPTWPGRLGFALLAFVFALHWFAMLKPEAGPDALALHLAVPADLALHHVLTFQPELFVWAVMPMGGDFLYAIVYQLGGEHGARLLNLALLALLLALLDTAIRRWVPPAVRWLLLALFAATPLAHLVTGELFVENLLAALLLAAFLAIGRRAFLAAALLAGAALASKLGALPVVAGLAVYAAWQRPPRRHALAAALLLLAAAAPTYLVAWAKTGNPLFPFLNERLHSPLLPPGAGIRDDRFRQPLTWHTPYDLTFHSNLYFEGQRGGFGFQYLAFAALALAAVPLVRRRRVTAAAGVALAAACAVLRADPNARYLYPELPLLVLPFAALLSWSAARARPLWRALVACALAAALLDIWFLPASSYWHRDLWGPFTAAQRERYLPVAAPIRVVIAWFERAHAGAPVLLAGDTAVAGFTGPVYENQWHQYNTMERIRRAPDGAALRALLDQWGVGYVIARQPGIGRMPRPRTLRDLIAQCGTPEFAAGEFYVTRLDPGCTGVDSAPAERARQPEIVAVPGRYDDFDPAIVFRGDWERTTAFEEPLAHTTSYTDEADAEIAFAFRGSELSWIFARAPNRGIAEVSLDGISRGAFDLYARDPQWRSRLTFGGLAPGRHLLVIRVTGNHRAQAQGAFVDLDAFEVK